MLYRSQEPDYLRELPVPFNVMKVAFDDEGRPTDLVYVYVNEAAARLEGLSREELTGSSFYGLYPHACHDLLALLGDTAANGTKQYFTRYNPVKERYYSIRTYRPQEGFCACVLEDVTDRVELEARSKEERRLLELQATRDPLTGLLHVRQGRDLVEAELGRPRWQGALSALFMFDVDDFKKVNDRHGHHRGDLVLKQFAQVLEQSFRRNDIVFRAGGDEFSAFVADIPCACVAERICSDVVRGVERLSREGVEVSVSVGVAVGGPGHAFEELYCAADLALYGIKRTGKSAYRILGVDEPLEGPEPQGSDAPKAHPSARTQPAA